MIQNASGEVGVKILQMLDLSEEPRLLRYNLQAAQANNLTCYVRRTEMATL